MRENIYCVVLNWNGKHFLKNCLDSILSSDYKNLGIVLVDNASTDGSVEFVKKNYKSVNIISNKSNLGWTGGNNKGVRYALKQKADAVFVLNNDTILSKNCISKLSNILFSKDEIGIVGPKIYLLNEKGKKTKTISFAGGRFTNNRYFGVHLGNNKKDTGKFEKVKESEYITGAAILIKRKVFEKIGFFDDKYFIYYDESDFCLRAKKVGFYIYIQPKAVAYHAFSGTVEINSPFQRYYTTRNHYLFVERNAPIAVKVREFLRTPKTAYEFYKNNFDKYSLLGIRDYYLRYFGKRRYWQ